MNGWRATVAGVVVLSMMGVVRAEDVTLTGYVPDPRLVADEIIFKTSKDYDNPIYKVDPNDQTKLDKLDVNTLKNLGNLEITGSLWVQGTPIGGVAYRALTVDSGPTTLDRTSVVPGHPAGSAWASIGTAALYVSSTAAAVAGDATLYVRGPAPANRGLHVQNGTTFLDEATEVKQVAGTAADTFKVTGRGTATSALHVLTGKTFLDEATEIKQAAGTAADTLKVTGRGTATSALHVLTGKTFLDEATEIKQAAGTAADTLKVTGRGTSTISLHALNGKTSLENGGAANTALNVFDGKTMLDEATEIKQATGSAAQTLKVTGTGVADTGLLVTNGETKLERKTTIGLDPATNGSVVLEVHGNVKVGTGNTAGGNGKLEAFEIAAQQLIVDDWVKVRTQVAGGPTVTLDDNITAINDIILGGKLLDKQDNAYFIDPDTDGKLKKLTVEDEFKLLGDLDVQGVIKNSSGSHGGAVKVGDDFIVGGTSDLRGTVFKTGGNLTLGGNVDIKPFGGQSPQISTLDPSGSFCLLGAGGTNTGAGCLLAGGGKAGALCTGPGGGCHLQVYSASGGIFDADDAGSINIGDGAVAVTTNFNNGTINIGGTSNVTAAVKNSSTLKIETGGTFDVTAGNFTTGDPNTTAAATAKVLVQNGSKAEWQKLPAAPAAYAPSQFCFTSVRNSGACNPGEIGVGLASGETLCFLKDTKNCGP